MKTKLIGGLAALSMSLTTLASPVWKVEKDGDHVYVGGTMHVLSEAQYPLPEVFDKAYQASDEVYFETDIVKAKSPEFQMAVMQSMTYQNGGSIADDLSTETLESLKAHLTTRGLPYEQVQGLKASLMGVTLTAIELQIAGVVAKGVDEHFHGKASGDQKPIAWLESVETQVAALAAMGEGQEDEFVRYSLDNTQDTPNMIKNMVANWRGGNVDTMDEEFLKPMRDQFPKVYDDLVVKRNNDWLPQIEAMFEDDNVEFVLVGLLHLAGEDSVFNALEAKGYTITKL